MKEFVSDTPYQPISCELHSEYELAIMHKNTLCLTWHKNGQVVIDMKIIPVDIQTKDKAEYLIVKTSENNEIYSIRLDYIIEICRYNED